MRAFLRNCWVSIILTTLMSCGSPLPNRDVREILAMSNVEGVWKLSDESLRLMIRDGFTTASIHQYTITLNLDGTCKYSSVVDDLEKPSHMIAEGNWIIEHDTTGDSNVKKKNALRLELVSQSLFASSTQIVYLNFAREHGSLLLWNYHRDPDSCEYIEYTKNQDEHHERK